MNEPRLPHNVKEELIYGGVICFITVIIMLTLNIGVAFGGFGKEAIKTILLLTPVIFVIAMLIEALLVGKISAKLVEKFTEPADGFNTRILFNILFCVTGMSAIMTIVGGMIGEGKLSMEPFITFASHWPRNFFVAFWCEMLFAQPTARKVMKLIHQNTNKGLIDESTEENRFQTEEVLD